MGSICRAESSIHGLGNPGERAIRSRRVIEDNPIYVHALCRPAPLFLGLVPISLAILDFFMPHPFSLTELLFCYLLRVPWDFSWLLAETPLGWLFTPD